MIVRSGSELEGRSQDLGPGDVVLGPLHAKHLRGPLAADLLERGVRFTPSVLCQVLSRSKCAQAEVLGRWMAPHTRVVMRRSDLMETLSHCRRHGIGAVVTKQEGMHCGHGVRRWPDAETLYNTTAFDRSAYPMVVQPFLPEITDLRVIVAGGYLGAYVRENPHNFRANLAAGGSSRPAAVDREAGEICRAVMERGRFPYAHIDLQQTPDGNCYLSEITLDGGIAGAAIGRAELNRLKAEVLEEMAHSVNPIKGGSP
jgi:ribosomal protein S6--L-glutamate ligase